MGNHREFKHMASISDGYWGFINQQRFYRFTYAALTYFAMFALVATFFQVGSHTRYAPQYLQDKLKLDNATLEENERMLQYIYVFFPTPFMFAWVVVYLGQFLICWRIKRLRKARNYKYNLLIGTIIVAFSYALIFKLLFGMDVIDGPKLRASLIMAFCEFSLIGIEVFDEHQLRVARHRRKELLRLELEAKNDIQADASLQDGNAGDRNETNQRGASTQSAPGILV